MANNQMAQVAAINERLNKVGQKLGISATQSTDVSGTIKFSVNFNPSVFYSGFLKENLEFIQKTLQPLKPVIELLNTEVPLLSDYPDVFNFINRDANPNSISVVDVVGYAAEKFNKKPVDVSLVSEVLSFSKFVNNLRSDGNGIKLGELTVDPSGIVRISSLPFDPIRKPDLPATFGIPLLSNPPKTIFGILQGNNETIFSYVAPKLELNIKDSFSLTVPVGFGVVGVTGSVGGGIAAQLGFGFDTYGLQQNRDFSDGFYITDFTGINEVQLEANLGIGPSITAAGLASLAVTVNVKPGIGFDLNDLTPGDGKVRLSEIKSFEALFKKPKPILTAGLGATIDILGVPITGVGVDSEQLELGGFPPTAIEKQADKVLGYIEQIKDMHNGKTVARILKKGGEYVVDKADQSNKWRREKTDQFGNFVEEQYERGKALVEGKYEKGVILARRAWDESNNFVKGEIYKAGQLAETITKQGEILISKGVDGVEKIWDGAKTTYKKGARVVEWIDDTVTETIPGLRTTWLPGNQVTQQILDQAGKVLFTKIWDKGILKIRDVQNRLFNAAGDLIDENGGIIQKGANFLDNAVDKGEGFLDSLFLDGGDPNQTPAKPNLRDFVGDKPNTDRPSATHPITYREDGSIFLQSGSGSDVLEGTALDDEIRAGDGNDYIAGNGGKDLLYGEGGNDILDGGDDNDILDGSTGNDTVKGGNGNDSLNGGANNDILDGEQGNDQLFGQDGDDQLVSSTGSDVLDGGANVDTVSYGKDPDYVIINLDETQGYSNTASPFDLEPTFGIAAGNARDGFGNVDTIRNLENIKGSAYNDVLIGKDLKNTLQGLDGDDLLIGNGGDDILDGGNGIDTVSYRRDPGSAIVNLSLNQAKDGFGGTDTIYEIENIIGSASKDTLIGDSQNNTILGGDGNDIIDGKEGSDQLYGENDNDTIAGSTGDDSLNGGNGADLLKGEAGNDLIDGGNDIDTVTYDNSPNGVAVNIDETSNYNNPNSSSRTTIVATVPIPTAPEPGFSIAAGTALDGFGATDTLRNLENIIGSQHNDVLIGNELDNQIEGLDGNDLLIGNAGDDRLDGGAGVDGISYRFDPNSVIVDLSVGTATDGYEDTDTLISIENVTGSNFDDTITGNTAANIIFAGAGNDTVAGRADNDILFGEAGQDTLQGEADDDFLVGGADADRLDGGDGIDTASYFNSSARVAVNLTTGSGRFGDAEGDRLEAIENLEGSEFEDLLTGNQIDNIISGLDGNDLIYGEAGNDWLDGGNSNDRLYGGEGNDQIYGQADVDLLKGEAGNDALFGGTGNDQIYGDEGDDTLKGETGNDYLEGGTGDDQLSGSEGNDQIYGQDGSDTLNGEIGDDQLVFSQLRIDG